MSTAVGVVFGLAGVSLGFGSGDIPLSNALVIGFFLAVLCGFGLYISKD